MKHLLRNDRLVVKGDDTVYVVIDAGIVAGRIRMFDEQEEREVFLKVDDVRKAVAGGDWLHERPGQRPHVASPQKQNDPALNVATQQALGIVRDIQRLAKNASLSTRMAIQSIREMREKELAPNQFPSDATIYRFLRRERNGLPLYAGNKNKGNRTARHSSEIRSMVVGMAKAHFLQVDSRWTLRDLVKNVNVVAMVEDMALMSERISRKYVKTVLVEEFGPDLDIDRMDRRTSNSLKSVVKATIVASSPFERVEQDGLHLPWRVVTPDGVSHNIYWLHAIDCDSGMPAGWKIVVGSPNVTNTLQCVESILYSKATYLESLGLSAEKDCYGTPLLLVLDNGPENKGDRITKLAHLGIDVMHCKAHTPQEKPYIERLNRALKEALQTLPGCTRFDDVDGQRDPEALNDLPMSLADLERWIVRWYFEDWANRNLKRLLMSAFKDPEARGRTPWTRWQHATQVRGQAVALPPSRQEWQRTMYVYESRTLSRKTGISYSGFMYKGPHMQHAIDSLGETSVTVLIDPDDFRRVYVLGPKEELIELVNTLVDETTPAYSFAQAAKVISDAEEEDKKGKAESLAFRHDLFKASTAVAPKQSKRASKPETTKQTTARAKNTRAVERAVRSPLSSTAAAESTNAPTSLDFEDVQPMQVFDRRSGEAG